MLPWLNRDGRLILAARAARAFGYGFLAVVLGRFLDELGLDPVRIGVILSASLIGAAALTLFLSSVADRWGRRRLLKANAVLMAAAGLAFALGSDFWLLLVAALTGTISVATNERGGFLTIEQAILPQTAPAHRRTLLFSLYNVGSAAGGALGALLAGLPALLPSMAVLEALRLLFLLYAILALVALGLFLALGPAVELQPGAPRPGAWGVRRSTRTVAKLSALFSVDSFGGGLVIEGFLAYWLHTVQGISLEHLGQLFFAGGLLEAASFLAAAPLAGRIGLVNTMVFTHIPSSVFLSSIALAPSPFAAGALFLARQSLSRMDVPTRQSYLMAVVDPEERAGAAGITNVVRIVAQSISPTIAGFLMQSVAVGAPLLVAGPIKIGYDLALWRSFKDLHPPEEAARHLRA